jgi:hypothetical protein
MLGHARPKWRRSLPEVRRSVPGQRRRGPRQKRGGLGQKRGGPAYWATLAPSGRDPYQRRGSSADEARATAEGLKGLRDKPIIGRRPRRAWQRPREEPCRRSPKTAETWEEPWRRSPKTAETWKNIVCAAEQGARVEPEQRPYLRLQRPKVRPIPRGDVPGEAHMRAMFKS